jgi:hypothetical protein
LLDGFKVTDELFNNLVINPSVDSIQEFKIQKSQYPAEFGGKASALINVATRTGTNAFHANVFDFGRNDRFDARNYFAPKDQPVHRFARISLAARSADPSFGTPHSFSRATKGSVSGVR